jgi:Na+/phosphate symporter
VRKLVGRVTRAPLRTVSLGVVTGVATQATTAAAALLSGLLGARMLPPMAASLLLIGAQLGAALSAVLLPSFATRDALWVVVLGSLWVLLSENRLDRALGSIVVGAGLIFHGLGLLQDGCGPLLSDPQVVPYLWYLQAGGLTGGLACAAAGALASALMQGPSLVFALTVSLVNEDVLGLHEALAILSGVSLGAIVNTWAATWAFGSEARRMLRVEAVVAPLMTGVAMLGLPLWERCASWGAGHFGCLATASAELGVGFVAMSLCSSAIACALLPIGTRLRAGRSLRESLAPRAPSASESLTQLLSALHLCRQGLAGVREIIKSGDRSSAPQAEQAAFAAQSGLQALLRSPSLAAQSGTRGASVAALHLAEALLSALRIAEKAPELGLTPSGETAQALEQLHALIDGALHALCEQLQAGQLPSLMEAQAREIEINAAEAEIRRRLFASQSSGEELSLRLWSSELCSAYESVGNQVYRAASAVAADDDL